MSPGDRHSYFELQNVQKKGLMSFWSSLFGGQSKTLNSDINKTGQVADFASGTGQSSTTKGTNWFSSILSGDPTKIGQALAPAIAAGQQGVQQQKNQIANFGNRSGGSTAKANALESENRGNITKAVGEMQSGAASTLLSSGDSLLSKAMSGFGQEASLDAKRMENWRKSILGAGTIDLAQTGLNAAEGGMGL